LTIRSAPGEDSNKVNVETEAEDEVKISLLPVRGFDIENASPFKK